MVNLLLSGEKDLVLTGQDVVRIFYPNAKVVFEPCVNYEFELKIAASGDTGKLTGHAQLIKDGTILTEETGDDYASVLGDERNHQKRLVKLAIFRLLCRFTENTPGPWGILTGVRPTKIVHRLLDLGWNRNRIEQFLISGYDMAPDKASLLSDIALRQRSFLLSDIEAEHKVSVYLGIPFCPTRCAYCSFPAFSAGSSGFLMSPFLAALEKEIREIGNYLKAVGRSVHTIYVGGGTPTVLGCMDLRNILRACSESLVSNDTIEFTLEAGRPDTITAEKLYIAREFGVTRISINPQTMNEVTLQAIGRRHDPDDVVSAFNLARRAGFENINMDIILGLPGENSSLVENTLMRLSQLGPENLTVHTLAIKRASNIKEAKANYSLPGGKEVSQMLEITAGAASRMGMKPYYLYRQKNMVGPYENIGYAKPGRECLYNIQIIEERQTIVGIGGGAGSKFVEPGTWYLTSHYNPKDPQTYINRIDEIIDRKKVLLQRLFLRINTHR